MDISSPMSARLSDIAKRAQGLAEVFGEEPSGPNLALWDIFVEAATSWPEREAIVSLWQPRGLLSEPAGQQVDSAVEKVPLRWTYTQLKEKAERLSKSLQKIGCQSGMQIAVVLWNSAEWALFFWASAKLGTTFVPLDPTTPDEARAAICCIRPDILVIQDSTEITSLRLSKDDIKPSCVRVHCSGQGLDGWMSLDEVSSATTAQEIFPLQGATTDEKHGIDERHAGAKRVALVVFTSGTTGNPKGCQHTDRNLISQSHDFDPDPSVTHRWLVHTPTFHIFAINNVLRAWRYGGTVIFPAKSFDVDSTLEALIKEQCSVMSATPTLVKALLAHPSFPNPQDLNLHLVTIGGTIIGSEDIRLCRQALGAEHVIQVYGMSEGAPLVTFVRGDPLLVEGFHPGVGKVLPGAALRVCRPESHDILQRGEIGELHISGSSVIKDYLGGDVDNALYSDEFGTWLVTGDQAQIDEHGVVYILGRYNDLIIRGGENIYPARMESRLNAISGLQAQVIGTPDTIAGQVPVAVVKLPEGVTKLDVAKKAQEMGRKYTLDAVYTLTELGLEEFPVTSMGKVKKEVLRRAVAEFRKARQVPICEPIVNGWHATTEQGMLVQQLAGVWQQLTGISPSKDDNILYLADSITLLRYCENVLRVCEKRLYLQDLIENDTIEKQARVLLTRDFQQSHFEAASGAISSASFPSRGVKRSAQELSSDIDDDNDIGSAEQHAVSNETLPWKSTHEAIAAVGLANTKIEDTLHIRKSLHRMLSEQRPQSFQNRIVFYVRDIDGAQIRRGLEKALASRPLMRTMVCWSLNKSPCHIVLPASEEVFDRLLHDAEVASEEEASELSKADSVESRDAPFMFQGLLIKIAQGKQYYLTMTFNHSISDVMSLTHWHRELDRLLQNPDTAIPALTPYKLFSGLFNQYANSEPAQKSVEFHLKRLRGISRFRQALWPQQRAPGWMIGNDEASTDAAKRLEIRDKIWQGTWGDRALEFQYPRCCRAVWLPGLTRLMEVHAVHPSLLTKCAILIFNVLRTGSSHALLNVWESGRSWPFVPAWMEKLLPPAMSIDGPTVEWILNMTEVVKDETVSGFFRRMASEQEQMRQHQHVPWDQVVRGLSDEGHVAVDASYRQSFVWDVSMGMSASRAQRIDFTALEPKARYGWPDSGVFWNAYSIDKDNIYFIASWDTAQMNDVEIDGHCDSLADVIRKLVDEKNWERTVGEVFKG